MNLDLDKYDASKPIVLNYFNGVGGKDIKRTISMGAQITGVPCIVIAFWLGAYVGWSPEILGTITRLKNFYGYSDLLNKPQGYPGT